ncbi:unnamed protein product, partial [Laminaria digitata]
MNHVKDASREGATPAGTVVEGIVVEHELRWHSMPEYLNFGFGTKDKTANPAELRDIADVEHRQGRAVNAPKVSVTLSDYLSADYSQPPDDPSCDFGWFTPTASGGSIDDLLPCGDHNNYYNSGSDYYLDVHATPSPSYTIPNFLFSKFGSTSKTATLSPDSTTGVPSREPASRQGPSHPHHHRRSTDAPHNGHSQQQHQPQQQQAQLLLQQDSKNPRPPNAMLGSALLHSASGSSGGGGAGGGSSRSTGSGSGLGLPGPPPRRTAANRMPEINQWHALHRHVSGTGALSAHAASGNCTLHLRRASFPISTRHFPEKPATTPRAKSLSGVGDGGGGGGSSRLVNGLVPHGRVNINMVGSPSGTAASPSSGLEGGGERKTPSGQQVQADAG